MPTLRHLAVYFKDYSNKNKSLLLAAFLFFFWNFFDGITGFVVPLVITESGFSGTMMGIIVGSSSIFGAAFDFLLTRYSKNVHFRRTLLLMFIICLFYPLILWQGKTFWLYLIAMAMWGVYFDLSQFGIFDFVSRCTPPEEHSASFGVIQAFRSLAKIISPLLVGLVVLEFVNWKPFALAWFFIFLSFVCFLLLLSEVKKWPQKLPEEMPRKRNFLTELHLWEKIGKILFPVLLLTLLQNIVDAFFWTIGPLFGESSKMLALGGLFLVAYCAPMFFVGWVVGRITGRLGKKSTAFLSFILGSLVLILMIFVKNPILVIGLAFVASIFINLSWPAINGAYADYISEDEIVEEEIMGIEDFFANIGYVIGPILAGVMLDWVGVQKSFVWLGVVMAILALYLYKITPKKINMNVKVE